MQSTMKGEKNNKNKLYFNPVYDHVLFLLSASDRIFFGGDGEMALKLEKA